MKTAFYVGKGKALNYLIRFVQRLSGDKYWQMSHCETILCDLGEGFYLCDSASAWDGGVRMKAIDLTSGNWVIKCAAGDEENALHLYKSLNGKRYDYLGAFKHIFKWMNGSKDKWFCSEICAWALGIISAPRPSELFKEVLNGK